MRLRLANLNKKQRYKTFIVFTIHNTTFQDMRKKIQVIKRNVLGYKEELDAKLSKVDEVEKQLEVAEIGITRRRTKMIALQERSDAKTDRLRNAKLQLAMLDENNKRNSFCEDLEDLEIVYEPPKVEDRSKLSFADILRLSKNSPKKDTKQQNKKDISSKFNKGNCGKYSMEFKHIKENLSEHQFKRREVEKNLEMSKQRIEQVANKFSKEMKRVSIIQDKVTKM